MSTPKFLNTLVPELNYWFNRTLFNNLFNKKKINCPTKMSDFWRSTDSVIELIFNETADPSGETYDDGYHFRWKYRTINLSKLSYLEPMLFRRIQVYYNSTWVYVAKDDPKFKDIVNLTDSKLVVQDYDYPYGIKPTKYVTYKSHIVGTGSDQLQYDDPDYPESESEEPYIVKEAENVFGLTDEELDMCENLYLYRVGQYESIPDWDCDYWDELESPLSKWIMCYIQCYLRNFINYERLRTLCREEDGSFRCLCEKHLQDRVYEYVNKQFMCLEEKINATAEKDRRTFVSYTLKNNVCLQKDRITCDDIDARCVVVKSIDKILNDRNSFEFILDGLKLKQGVDYTIKNIDRESDKRFIVSISKNVSLTEWTRYQLMYNYVYHKNPITGIDVLDEK